jgi:hypothetical protein
MGILNYFLIPSIGFVIFDFVLVCSAVSIALSLNEKVYKSHRNRKEKPTLFLWGDFLSREESQQEEDSFLKKVELKAKAKRTLVSIVSLLLAATLYLSFFSPSHLGYAGFIFLIVSSTYIGHLYFIALAKISLVLVFLAFSEKLGGGELFFIGLLCFQLVIFYSKGLLKKKIRPFVIFVVIFTSIQFLLPENRLAIKKQIEKRTRTIKYKRESSLLDSFAKKKAQRLLENKDNFSMHLGDLDSKLDSLEQVLKQLDDLSAFEKLGKQLLGESQKIKLEVEDLRKEIKALKQKQSYTDSDVEKVANFLKRLENMELDLKNVSGKLKEKSDDLSLNGGEGSSGLKEGKKLENLSIEIGKAGSGVKDVAKKLNDNIEGIRKVKKQATEDMSVAISKKSDSKKTSVDWVKMFEKISFTFIAILAFGLLKLLLSRFRREKYEIIGREEKKVFKNALKAIRHKNLSPNEEIIQSYNTFKDLIKETIYAKSEVPPPLILLETEVDSPELQLVTEIFNKCFYGSYSATSSDIKTFRSTFHKVMF